MKCLISPSRCPWRGRQVSTGVPFRPSSLPEGGGETGTPNSWAGEDHHVLYLAGVSCGARYRGDSGCRGRPLCRDDVCSNVASLLFLGNRAPRSVSAPVAPGRLLPLFLLSTPSLSSCHAGFREHPPKPSDELGPLCWHPPAWTVLPLSCVCRLPWVSAQRSFSQ